MNQINPTMQTTAVRLATYFVRFALAAAFLSAVADRFGIWGPPGAEGVAWGDVQNYENYVALLNWFAPAALVPALGWIATIAEVTIAMGLLIGWQLRWFALAAGVLLITFAVSMCRSIGMKPPLDYSVFSAASAAFLLFAIAQQSDSADICRSQNA